MIFSKLIILSILLFVQSSLISSQYVPILDIYRCNSTSNHMTNVTDFTLTSNYGLAIQQTFVAICYDDEYLHLRPNCIDNNIQSPFAGNSCNLDLFEADVFEVFVSYGPNGKVPVNYLEVELSPYGALFVSLVNNPYDACSGIQDNLVDCSASGIVYGASTNTIGWEGSLQIPFQLIQKASQMPYSNDYVYQFNMFRIDAPLYNYKEYSCYHADNTNPPCFHVPSYFSTFKLN